MHERIQNSEFRILNFKFKLSVMGAKRPGTSQPKFEENNLCAR